MQRLTVAMLTALAAVAHCRAQAQDALVKGGERILWIGNSFSDWCGPIDVCLSQMFQAANPPVTNVQFTHRFKGMGILKEYYRGIGMDPSAVATIRQGGWDYIVVQGWQDSYLRKDSELITSDYVGWPAAQDTFVAYARLFRDEAVAVGARLIMFFPHIGVEMHDNHNYEKAWSTYNRVATETGAYIMPGIEAFDSVHTLYPNEVIPRVYGYNGHQNSNGMALNAYFCYTILTGGRSPVGVNPPNFRPANDCDGTFTPSSQRELQEIAFATATEWLNGGGAVHAREVPRPAAGRAGRQEQGSHAYTVTGQRLMRAADAGWLPLLRLAERGWTVQLGSASGR